MSAPYYVAVYGGFLVIEDYPSPVGNQRKVFTAPNVRMASTFTTFDDADRTAKWAVARLYPPDIRYFAVLAPTFGGFQ